MQLRGIREKTAERRGIFKTNSYLCGELKRKTMATYTITINEKTKSGKSLVSYLRSLGVIDEKPNNETLEAMKDVENGKVTTYGSFEEYLEAFK